MPDVTESYGRPFDFIACLKLYNFIKLLQIVFQAEIVEMKSSTL